MKNWLNLPFFLLVFYFIYFILFKSPTYQEMFLGLGLVVLFGGQLLYNYKDKLTPSPYEDKDLKKLDVELKKLHIEQEKLRLEKEIKKINEATEIKNGGQKYVF